MGVGGCGCDGSVIGLVVGTNRFVSLHPSKRSIEPCRRLAACLVICPFEEAASMALWAQMPRDELIQAPSR